MCFLYCVMGKHSTCVWKDFHAFCSSCQNTKTQFSFFCPSSVFQNCFLPSLGQDPQQGRVGGVLEQDILESKLSAVLQSFSFLHQAIRGCALNFNSLTLFSSIVTVLFSDLVCFFRTLPITKFFKDTASSRSWCLSDLCNVNASVHVVIRVRR